MLGRHCINVHDCRGFDRQQVDSSVNGGLRHLGDGLVQGLGIGLRQDEHRRGRDFGDISLLMIGEAIDDRVVRGNSALDAAAVGPWREFGKVEHCGYVEVQKYTMLQYTNPVLILM